MLWLLQPMRSKCIRLYHIPTAETTHPPTTKSGQFAGLCEVLAFSTPEVIEFTGLCEKLTILDNSDALAVVDKETGKLLEHPQLRKDPRYKKVWDRSSPNMLVCLCQGIGTGDKAGGKRIAGTNTFHIIVYADIPYTTNKKRESTQRWCVRYRKVKMMKIARGAQLGVTSFAIPVTQAPTQHHWN